MDWYPIREWFIMRTSLILPMLAALLLLAACVPETELSGNDTNTTDVESAPVEPVETEPTEPTVPEESAAGRFTLEGTEGDLIELKPQALDPDGDRIIYTFTKPFDKDGRWQTQIGDEGTHTVVVGATDGKSTTTESVDIIVHRANRAPVIECKDVAVSEGDNIDLHQACSVTDEDDTEVVVTYGGWMSSWRYQTTYEDAGTHVVTITASDKRQGEILHTVTKDVTVTVSDVNRPPVFSDDFPAQITATENDVITLPKTLASDPDKDPITLTYSAPFDQNGVWKTKIGDAGTYEIDIVASDGETTAKRTVTVKIGLLNTAPVLKTIPDITVKEGETVKLQISATDREGDRLTTTISGWMTSDTYKTTYEDAGTYTVKVEVTDGEFTASDVVQVTVVDVNRPPVFVSPA
jgi:hypothetical protein